jgi:hypothetical protein
MGVLVDPPKTDAEMRPCTMDLLLKDSFRVLPTSADSRYAFRLENPATSASVLAA